MHAEAAAAQDVALHAHDGEVGRAALGDPSCVAGLDVQQPEAVSAHPAGEAAAASIGTSTSRVEADAPAVEEDRRVAAPLAVGATPPNANSALVLEEELTLLGEEQAEAREVDLLLVGFDLREVGVVGEVGGQVLA